MKHIILLFALTVCSITAFAQFPLGSNKEEIKAYFNENINYATAIDFKTQDGVEALCLAKVRIVGDYTFLFDTRGHCSSYTVTYGLDELPEVVSRFDEQFCREDMTNWISHDKTFDVTLVPVHDGGNFFSIVYKPVAEKTFMGNTLASN
jgi:hypothetical protein